MSLPRPSLGRARRWLGLLPLALLASASAATRSHAARVAHAAHAASLPRSGAAARQDPPTPSVPYDGRFTFARLKYVTGPGGYYYRGLPAWAHGYPTAERNLTRIFQEISTLRPRVEESVVLAIDDPELFRYPVAFLTEAGFWAMTDREALALRAYLRKGGFLIFDDFRDDPWRGGGGWEHFAENMQRVLPGVRFLDLDTSLPVFHDFFDIDSFDIVPQYYDRGRPVFRGIYEDNDPTKRLMAVINFNTDISNFWEFSASGYAPVEESNQAYKLGIDYVIYGLTH